MCRVPPSNVIPVDTGIHELNNVIPVDTGIRELSNVFPVDTRIHELNNVFPVDTGIRELNNVFPVDTGIRELNNVFPVDTGIHERQAIHSGPVSEYEVTFLRRNHVSNRERQLRKMIPAGLHAKGYPNGKMHIPVCHWFSTLERRSGFSSLHGKFSSNPRMLAACLLPSAPGSCQVTGNDRN